MPLDREELQLLFQTEDELGGSTKAQNKINKGFFELWIMQSSKAAKGINYTMPECNWPLKYSKQCDHCMPSTNKQTVPWPI